MSKNKDVAVLSRRQKMVLMTYVQQALFSPETAATMVVNPRPAFLRNGLSEDDVENIAEFLDLINGLKRGGGTNAAAAALHADPDTTTEAVEASLSDDQITTLTDLVDQALASTETLQDFFDNAQEQLLAAGLTAEDISAIAEYLKVVKHVIELDRSADW